MTIHCCGDSDLDPMNCPACNSGDRVPSGSVIALAEQAMARAWSGKCVGCGKDRDRERESNYCEDCE